MCLNFFLFSALLRSSFIERSGDLDLDLVVESGSALILPFCLGF